MPASLVACAGLSLTAVGAESPVELVRVADGVYAAIQPEDNRFNDSNTLVVVNTDHVLVVDSQASPSNTRAIIDAIRKVTDRPVRYLVSTHFHGDHVQSHGEYVSRYPGVLLLAHRTVRDDIQRRTIPELRKEIETGGPEIEAAEKRLAAGVTRTGAPLTDDQKRQNRQAIDAFRERLAQIKDDVIPLPTLTYDEALTLYDGKREIRLMHFRAHTRGDTLVFLPVERVLATGDLLDDLPYGGHGYPAAWVKTLNTIATLDFDRIVPGHGRIREGKDHLRLVTEMFESIVAQVNAAIGRKLSLEDTRKSVDLTRFRETLAVDARAGRTFDAWMPETIERAYLEATGKLNTEQDR